LTTPQKFWHYNGSKMDFPKITYTINIPNIVQITDITKLAQPQQQKIKANPCIIYHSKIFQKSLKILKVQINWKESKRLNKVPGMEIICRKRQKRTRNSEKTWKSKWKKEGCGGRKERDAILKPVGYPSRRPLPNQHSAESCASGLNRPNDWAAHVWTQEEDRPDASHRKTETGGKFAKKYISLKIVSEHVCIINW